MKIKTNELIGPALAREMIDAGNAPINYGLRDKIYRAMIAAAKESHHD